MELFCILKCCAVGYVLAKICISLWSVLYPFVLGKKLGRAPHLPNLGKWAVVTGSTDGIGKAYATELARLKLNICLISRSKQKLEAVRQEIADQCSDVEITCLPFDFSTADIGLYDNLLAQIKHLDIGILVNNVGMGTGYPEYFEKLPGGKQIIANLINVNCMAASMLTHEVLPRMLERKRGAIVNISSSAGLSVMPLMHLYGASKIFITQLTRNINAEHSNSSVIVQAVNPYYVATKMSTKQPSYFSPSPASFAREAIGTIGLTTETTGCLAHSLQHVFMSMFPSAILSMIIKQVLLRVRKKAIEELEKEKSN